MKKINLNGLKNVLSPKEMKNVKGGTYTCECTDHSAKATCYNSSLQACESDFEQYCEPYLPYCY